MHEQQRQAYLQAFDIDSYEPRWVLPNALPSIQCDYEWLEEEVFDLPSAVDSTVYPAHVDPAQANTGPSGGAALEADAELPARERTHKIDVSVGSKQVSEKKVASRQSSPPKPQVQLRFALSVWRVAPDLLVVDSRRPRLALPTDALLLNILRALGYSLERLPAVERVRWPITASHSPAEEQVRDARAYVQAYLQAQSGHFPFSRVLLMGASAVRFSLDEQHWPEDDDPRVLLGKQFPLDSFSDIAGAGSVPGAIVVPSLSAMLQAPALKAITWQAIQPLRLNALQSVEC